MRGERNRRNLARRIRRQGARRQGFTLIELMLGATILAVVAVALIGGYLGESYLNENARNMMAAMNDATRVMEQIRVQNVGCTTPSAVPPLIPPAPPNTTTRYASWNDWLNVQTPAKTVDLPNANARERIVVMCQDGGKALPVPPPLGDYCGWEAVLTNDPPKPAQIGSAEWRDQGGDISGAVSSGGSQRGRQSGNTTFDPIRVTVSVGWLQRGRTVGGSGSGAEFTTNGTGASATVNPGPDANNNGLIDSQVMLTTLMTCR